MGIGWCSFSKEEVQSRLQRFLWYSVYLEKCTHYLLFSPSLNLSARPSVHGRLLCLDGGHLMVVGESNKVDIEGGCVCGNGSRGEGGSFDLAPI